MTRNSAAKRQGFYAACSAPQPAAMELECTAGLSGRQCKRRGEGAASRFLGFSGFVRAICTPREGLGSVVAALETHRGRGAALVAVVSAGYDGATEPLGRVAAGWRRHRLLRQWDADEALAGAVGTEGQRCRVDARAIARQCALGAGQRDRQVHHQE